MDTLLLLIIISLGTFLISIITIGVVIMIRLGNRKNVHGVIFLKTFGQKKVRFNRLKDLQKVIDGETYIFDEHAVIKTNYKDFIYFMEGNPKPLIFNFQTQKPEIVSQDLKNILDSDLVQKLFSDEDMKLLKLLVIINIIVGVICLLLMIYIMMSGVTLKNNKDNYDFIYNVTRQAVQDTMRGI